MCHSCADISDAIVEGHDDDPTQVNWNYSLPSGASIDTFGVMVSIAESVEDSSLFTMEGVIMTTIKPRCKQPCHIGPMAVRCGLTPCVKTYGANVTNSIYKETEIDSTPLRSMFAEDRNFGIPARGFSLATDRTLRDGAWTDCNPTRDRTDDNTVEVFALNKTTSINPGAIPPGADTSTVWYPPDCVWYYGASGRAAAQRMLRDLLAGSDNKFEMIGGTVAQGPTWLQVLYHNATATPATVDAFVGGLALSMSAQIRARSADPPGMRAARGEVWEEQTCIEVRWGFIGFLALLLVLELVFCAATLVAWRVSGWRKGWKSSALPLLYHGLDEASEAGYADPEGSVKDMLATARETRVQLRNGDRGWRLYGTPGLVGS